MLRRLVVSYFIKGQVLLLHLDMVKMGNFRLKALVPRAIKRPIRATLLRRKLNRAITRIARLNDGQVPNRELLEELIQGWSNDGFVANLDYLEEVARRTVETSGNILECGSGITTILMGALCARRKTEVWSLENSDEWANRTNEILERHEIPKVHICAAPLIEYDGFSWYDPPLSKMPNEFSLVICDGPPGNTKGGRYGLLPVMSQRLARGTVVLVDDAGRAGEVELIKRWESEARFETKVVSRADHVFAVMRRM